MLKREPKHPVTLAMWPRGVELSRTRRGSWQVAAAHDSPEELRRAAVPRLLFRRPLVASSVVAA